MSINLGSLINKSINPVITKAVSDVKTSIGSQLPNNQVGQILSKNLDKLEKQATSSIDSIINKNLDKLNLPSIPDLNDIVTKNPDILMMNLTNSNNSFGAGINTFSDMLGMNVNSMYQQASKQLGLAKKTSSGKDIANNPNIVMQNANRNTNYMQYPLKSGEETNDRCCKMRISAFKYLYDPNDINGNKRTMDSDNIKSGQVKKLYVIDLPLPASLTSGFSAGWTDYTSLWSKLIRGSGGAMGDISSFDPKAFGENFIKMMGIPDQVSQDALKVGAGAAALSTALGGGIGQSVGEGISESLNYIRVNAGITVNPMSQAAYTGQGIREHAFEFSFVPRNSKEQQEVFNIISTLEDGSMGAKKQGVGGILLDFPDMFNIQFLTPFNNPIKGLIEIPDCFISNISVTRSPTRGMFQITRDNYPFAYILNIQFREAQALTRDDMKYLRQTDTYRTLNPNDEKEKTKLDISKLFPVTAPANVPKETTQQQANNVKYKGELTPGFSKKGEKEQSQIIAQTYYQEWKNLHKNNPRAYDLHDPQVLDTITNSAASRVTNATGGLNGNNTKPTQLRANIKAALIKLRDGKDAPAPTPIVNKDKEKMAKQAEAFKNTPQYNKNSYSSGWDIIKDAASNAWDSMAHLP